ncbi:MAG: hypothetical protein P8189_20765 [Anaerolineae bacterium]|jgi:hypothetical protein
MKNWLWAMVLVSLVVPLGGCGASDVLSPQPEQALQATPAASGETLASTVATSSTVKEPAPTDTLQPAVEEPTSTSTPWPTVPPTIAPPTVASSATPVVVHSAEDILRITPAEAKELLDSGRAVLYDVRSEGVYRARHAAGALSFPASDMVARYGELPTDKSLVFY